MYQRILPRPSKFGAQGRSGGTFESVTFETAHHQLEPDHTFHLAPIGVPNSYHYASSSSGDSRRLSTSSVTSYNLEHSPSPPAAPPPTPNLEPFHDHSPSAKHNAIHTSHVSPSQAPVRPAAKVTRRKWNDRKHLSRLRNDSLSLTNITKEQGDAGRRYDHSLLFAKGQRQLLAINPQFHEVAFQGKGKEMGWGSSRNNRCGDIYEDENGEKLTPLIFNKNYILASLFYVIEDSSALINDTVAIQQMIQAQAAALLESGAPQELKDDFLKCIAQGGAASSIATASAQRGSVGFQLPFFRTPTRL